ncbi:UDP-N-acetylmuramoyl-L-alanine--D-glutamate ligase [Endozoicomonas sp. SM1973]|uniref:UDP-N-acetylmuramoylalanine--D-glutamate ligase n=1 Tax=Spartinivicinus marinus TaxID=2994442 RepID=A0A853I4L2_9GAMM|nr:UDP-N-acetylmuramoyl-L-alanine--D-glutamate ligase [Spartinivicinus marinus]MCX4028313.1 UDP-N-acetylmuramoyl-L-alanine--D-glutamate ligase [Spartinivicinus marinus]NYZ65648.1 UDP-N-acetylmuramoyl-L-alanine--D-glutamate ligase [Spartinivicinus marinus]
MITSDQLRIVIGLGKTGYSCARFLAEQGHRVMVVDSRQSPPYLPQLQQDFPELPIKLGVFDSNLLKQASELIVSPGIALAEPAIAEAVASGVPAIGDIELFARAVGNTPVIAITGSNGKSTVTTLVGEIAQAAGIKVAVGGNIGRPVLELLTEKADLYVLELSSFQLETTYSLQPAVACILNISPDHMDRYADLAAYHQAKQRIYRGAQSVVFNRQDALTQPLVPSSVPQVSFGLNEPDLKHFGCRQSNNGVQLSYGLNDWLESSQLLIKGRHNQANVLAALAIGQQLQWSKTTMLAAIQQFKGLPHRCEWVAEYNQITFINDTKATNVGAAKASIEGLGEQLTGKIILLAGGDGKGADFSELKPAIAKYVKCLLTYGDDGERLAAEVTGAAFQQPVADLVEAVKKAFHYAEPGDLVLLAPACASFDMFSNFEQRGEVFKKEVMRLVDAQ